MEVLHGATRQNPGVPGTSGRSACSQVAKVLGTLRCWHRLPRSLKKDNPHWQGLLGVKLKRGPTKSGLQSCSGQTDITGSGASWLQSQGGSKPLQGSDKRQRSSGRRRSPAKRSGELSVGVHSGLKMTIICVGTLGRQLVCLCLSSLRRGSLGDTYWAKGAPIVVCQDWLNSKVLVMKAWKGSRCKMVGLEVLLIYKRVAAWFPWPFGGRKTLVSASP